MNIPEEVRLVLDKQSVSYGRLKLNAMSQSKHYAVTDYNKVYAKVLKPGTFSSASMLKSEIDFSMNTQYGTNPLMEQIVHRNSKGTTMVMSAWEYEQQVPITYSLNPIKIAQTANELYTIHSFPKYDSLRKDTELEFQEYVSYLSSYSFKLLSPVHQELIKNIYSQAVQPATQSLILNPDLNVVCHGEATLEKSVLRKTGVQWVDYESVRSAPREYDLSRMFLQLHHRLARPDFWMIFKNQYEVNLGRPLNDSLIHEFALLHLARRSLKMASSSLQTIDQARLLGFLRELTTVVSGRVPLEECRFRHLKSAS